MTTIFGLVGAILTIEMAGFGCAVLLAQRRLTLLEMFALPWLFGSALVSLCLWLLGLIVSGFLLQMIVTLICVSLGALGLARSRRVCVPAVQWSRFDWVFGILFVAELAIILCISLQHTLGWDGITVWELKARHAFQNGGVLPPNYFTAQSLWFSHATYPLLLPLTENWQYLWIGEPHQFWVKLLFPMWYVAGMSMLLLAVTEVSGRRAIGWIIVLLFPLVPAIYNAPGGIETGYADLPLTAIYTATIFYLLRYWRTGGRDAWALFIALAATMPWMKREGAVLWLVASVFGAVSILRWQGWRGAILSFAPGIAIIATWKVFVTTLQAIPSPDFTAVSIESLLTNRTRLPLIAHELLVALRDATLWNIFWLVVLIAVVCVVVRERNQLGGAILWFLLAPLIAYCASYVFSAWTDVIAHIDTSLPRLLIQLTPMAWLVVALALRLPVTSLAQLEPQQGAQSAPGTDYN